jgi:DNA-binding LytR/AlgR family response regulator
MDLEEQLTALGYQVTNTVTDSDRAINSFKKNQPDLVLLDIHLKGSKLDGVQIAEMFNEITRVPIIYLTSYSDRETQKRVERTAPAYYLIKPCSPEQLEVAIGFAISNFTNQQQTNITHSLNTSTKPACVLFSPNDFFFVKKKQHYVRINLSEILWLEAKGSSVEIVSEQESVISYSGIKGFLGQLEHPNLIQVHRSFVVNILKVTAFNDRFIFIPFEGDQRAIPVGQKYHKDVFKRFRQLKSE